MWFLVTCFFSVYLITHFFYKTRYNYWKNRKVPYEKPFSIFGNLYEVVKRKQHVFEKVRTIYNKFSTPYVGIFIFHKPSLLIRSPQLLKNILVKDSDKFLNRNLAWDINSDPLAFYALFFMRDSAWKELRSKFSPAFTSSKVKSMYSLMQERAEKLCSYLSRCDGQVVEMKLLMKKFSTDVMASCALGVSTDCYTNEDSICLKMADKLMNPKSFIRNVSMFSYFFMHSFVYLFKLTFADKEATDYLSDIFKLSVEERKSEKASTRNDFVDSVIKLENEGAGIKNYNDDVLAQVLTLFGAGTDTTALILPFIFYELSRDMVIQNRLRQEVRDMYDQKNFSYEAIQEIKYLDMVVNETLRKYPLAGTLMRSAGEDYLVEETGFTIEKGTSILVPVSGFHYDPEYFPDPYKFNPERFNAENRKNIPQCTYLPFGHGPRNCIGQKFALNVIKVSLATIIKNFKFEVTDKTVESPYFDPDCTTLIQIGGGLYLRIRKAL